MENQNEDFLKHAGGEYDFGGYATRYNVDCSDGLKIEKDAFKHHDGQTLPLVWQHTYNDPANILGNAKIEHREDGVYVYGKFNDTDAGKQAKALVHHKDITALSIFANGLKKDKNLVKHGSLKEVSLVLAGANPGAYIDFVEFQHDDGSTTITSDGVIYSGEKIVTDNLQHTAPVTPSNSNETMADVFSTLNEKQQAVVVSMLGAMMADGNMMNLQQSGLQDETKGATINDYVKGNQGEMKHNVFEKQGKTDEKQDKKRTLSHSDFESIFNDFQKNKGSLKECFLKHTQTYGIENIDLLFPDAKLVGDIAEKARDMQWVQVVMSGTDKVPFSKLKTMYADITPDEARAKGYVKTNLKDEQVIALFKRETDAYTIYIKQKLDRDDIVDVTTIDVVVFLKGKMRKLLNEEIARAILLGDGRAANHKDKINEQKIRPIWKDDDLYSHKVLIEAGTEYPDQIKEIIRSRIEYKGSGSPTMFVSPEYLTELLLLEDTTGRVLYPTVDVLAARLRVSNIVEVEIMADKTRVLDDDSVVKLRAIIVNLNDYTVGSNAGGEVTLFDDFDIDYNQFKYLMEGRMSGALTKIKSAIIIEEEQAA